MNEIYEIKELISKLNIYNKQYEEGHPSISDAEWDKMYFRLKDLENQTGIIYPNSPTQKINFNIVSKLPKVKHNHLMLSLDKTKEISEVQKFVKGQDWLAMFKLDGLSASLTYENGKLIAAETRGNGEEGESIIHNALIINNIPKEIPVKDRRVVIDGEIICNWSDFNSGLCDEYSHPRALVSGSIRLLSSQEAAKRKLRFVAWDLIEGEPDIDFFFWRLEKLDDWGFDTVPRVGDAETVTDAIEILNELKEKYDYPIDGYVFRFESQKYYNSLGNTDHHFRGAYAYKFYDEEYETELIDIEWSMGRLGSLTPIAIFKPIEIDGTIIERASLHNLSILRETLGLYPEKDQKIWIAKMNMIIPQITKAIKNDIPHDHILNNGNPQLMFCPYCGELTKIIKSDSGVLNVVCGNQACAGKIENKIDHYLGKKGLDVKGISNMTLKKLIAWGWISKISDVYELKEYKNEWINKPGFGTVSVNKVLNAIEESKHNVNLTSFISAIGIPLVGKTIAKEITKYYNTWSDFKDAVGGDWTEFEGFGPEISKSINSFDYSEFDEIAGMLDFAPLEVQSEIISAAAIKDKKFCATGKLQNFSRDSLKTDIENYGGKLVSSVTSTTDYLITNTPDSNTQKNKDAQRLGVKIITEEEYLQMRN